MKKVLKRNKDRRRQKEIVKAQAKTYFRDYSSKILNENSVQLSSEKVTAHDLNLKVIKTDLIKTAIFAVATVIFLFFVRNYDLAALLERL